MRIKLISVFAAFAVIITLPVFYEEFLFYPPMEYNSFSELYSIDNFLRLFHILLDQRIVVETSPPTVPYDEMPLFNGTGDSLIGFKLTNDSSKFNNSSECRHKLCAVIESGWVKSYSNTFTFIRFARSLDFDEAIQKLRRGEFTTKYGHPMSSLGRIEIKEVELKYYNQSVFHSWREKLYVPVWVIHAKTSNYGEETIFVEASFMSSP